MIDKSIFKAYDIRGIYPSQIDEETVESIGRAYVKFLKSLNPAKEKFTILIGRDMRISSPSLKSALIKGITDAGSDVIDVDLVSTPTFYYAVGRFGYDGGIQVSASHNPKEYNGLKIVRANAYPVGLVNGLDKIRDYAVEGKVASSPKGSVMKKEGILDDLVDFSMGFYDFSGIKPLKIVADTANAMSSIDLAALFEKLPCELVKMNFDLDGTFPAHQADPLQEKNVFDIKKRVVEEKADLGIATDGDGDRYFFIDDSGEVIDQSIIRGILSEVVLRHNPGADIGYDIRPGKITEDMIVQNGGKPFVTKVGHSLIKLEALKHNSPFSGESSGHFFFRTKYGTFETPLIVTLIILKEISDKGKAVSKIIAPLDKYFHSGEINSRVKDTKKVLKAIEDKFAPGARNVSHLDGILIEHEDYWFNVRTSNTEPLVRLNLEAKTKEVMEKMRDEVLAVIRES